MFSFFRIWILFDGMGNNVGHQRLSNNIKRKEKKTTLSLSIIFNYTFIHIFWFCNIKHSARWVFFFFNENIFSKKVVFVDGILGFGILRIFFIIYRSGSFFKKEWRRYWDEEPRENKINRSVILLRWEEKTKRTNWLQFLFLSIFSRIFKETYRGLEKLLLFCLHNHVVHTF